MERFSVLGNVIKNLFEFGKASVVVRLKYSAMEVNCDPTNCFLASQHSPRNIKLTAKGLALELETLLDYGITHGLCRWKLTDAEDYENPYRRNNGNTVSAIHLCRASLFRQLRDLVAEVEQVVHRLKDGQLQLVRNSNEVLHVASGEYVDLQLAYSEECLDWLQSIFGEVVNTVALEDMVKLSHGSASNASSTRELSASHTSGHSKNKAVVPPLPLHEITKENPKYQEQSASNDQDTAKSLASDEFGLVLMDTAREIALQNGNRGMQLEDIFTEEEMSKENPGKAINYVAGTFRDALKEVCRRNSLILRQGSPSHNNNMTNKSFESAPAGHSVRSLKVLFQRLDSSGNGELDIEEFVHALDLFGLKSNDTILESVRATFDTNGDGKISFEEFCQFLNHESSTGRELGELWVTLRQGLTSEEDELAGFTTDDNLPSLSDLEYGLQMIKLQPEEKSIPNELMTKKNFTDCLSRFGLLKYLPNPKDLEFLLNAFISNTEEITPKSYIRYVDFISWLQPVDVVKVCKRIGRFVKAVIRQEKGMQATGIGSITDMLKMLDRDQSGGISKESFQHTIDSLGLPVAAAEVRALYRFFNTGDSQMLSHADFSDILNGNLPGIGGDSSVQADARSQAIHSVLNETLGRDDVGIRSTNQQGHSEAWGEVKKASVNEQKNVGRQQSTEFAPDIFEEDFYGPSQFESEIAPDEGGFGATLQSHPTNSSNNNNMTIRSESRLGSRLEDEDEDGNDTVDGMYGENDFEDREELENEFYSKPVKVNHAADNDMHIDMSKVHAISNNSNAIYHVESGEKSTPASRSGSVDSSSTPKRSSFVSSNPFHSANPNHTLKASPPPLESIPSALGPSPRKQFGKNVPVVWEDKELVDMAIPTSHSSFHQPLSPPESPNGEADVEKVVSKFMNVFQIDEPNHKTPSSSIFFKKENSILFQIKEEENEEEDENDKSDVDSENDDYNQSRSKINNNKTIKNEVEFVSETILPDYENDLEYANPSLFGDRDIEISQVEVSGKGVSKLYFDLTLVIDIGQHQLMSDIYSTLEKETPSKLFHFDWTEINLMKKDFVNNEMISIELISSDSGETNSSWKGSVSVRSLLKDVNREFAVKTYIISNQGRALVTLKGRSTAAVATTSQQRRSSRVLAEITFEPLPEDTEEEEEEEEKHPRSGKHTQEISNTKDSAPVKQSSKNRAEGNTATSALLETSNVERTQPDSEFGDLGDLGGFNPFESMDEYNLSEDEYGLDGRSRASSNASELSPLKTGTAQSNMSKYAGNQHSVTSLHSIEERVRYFHPEEPDRSAAANDEEENGEGEVEEKERDPRDERLEDYGYGGDGMMDDVEEEMSRGAGGRGLNEYSGLDSEGMMDDDVKEEDDDGGYSEGKESERIPPAQNYRPAEGKESQDDIDEDERSELKASNYSNDDGVNYEEDYDDVIEEEPSHSSLMRTDYAEKKQVEHQPNHVVRSSKEESDVDEKASDENDYENEFDDVDYTTVNDAKNTQNAIDIAKHHYSRKASLTNPIPVLITKKEEEEKEEEEEEYEEDEEDDIHEHKSQAKDSAVKTTNTNLMTDAKTLSDAKVSEEADEYDEDFDDHYDDDFD